jgi:hypothetical protein
MKLLKDFFWYFRFFDFRLMADSDEPGGSDEPDNPDNPPETPDEGEEDTPSDDTPPDEDKDKPDDKPKKTKAERVAEIQKATYEKYEAARKLAAEREALAKEREEIQKMQGSTLIKPDPDNFKSVEEHHAALEEYYQKKAVIDAKKMVQTEAQENAAAAETEAAVNKWNLKKQQVMQDNPSIGMHDNIVDAALKAERAHPIVAMTLIQSEKSTDLVTYLANHPEELEKLAQKGAHKPQFALMQIGELTAKLSAKAKPSPKQPEPPGGNLGGGGASTDDSKLSQEDYNAKYNKLEREGKL